MSERQLLFDLDCLQKRRARKRFRKDIFDYWDNCAYCGRSRPTTLDHVLAKRRGGLTIKSNLVGACADCNLRKGCIDFMEWFRGQVCWTVAKELRVLEWVNT